MPVVVDRLRPRSQEIMHRAYGKGLSPSHALDPMTRYRPYRIARAYRSESVRRYAISSGGPSTVKSYPSKPM